MLDVKRLVKDVTVVKVKSYRGEPKTFVGKVVDIRDCHEAPVGKQTHARSVKTRSRWLVTLERVGPAPADDPDTTKAYYHAFLEGETTT